MDSQFPLTIFYGIFGSAAEVINWGVINSRRKLKGGGGGGGCDGDGDRDGDVRASNCGMDNFLEVPMMMTIIAVLMALILSVLVDSL